MAAMTWERRLRDMILAGGALTAIACGSSSSSPNSDSPVIPCCNGGGDPCCSLSCLGAADPDGARYHACEQSLAACEAMDGSYDPNADGSFACVVDTTAAIDGGSEPSEAGDDAGAHD
jgi:hypothetical protein